MNGEKQPDAPSDGRKRVWGIWIKNNGAGGPLHVTFARTNDDHGHRHHRLNSKGVADMVDTLVVNATKDPMAQMDVIIGQHYLEISIWYHRPERDRLELYECF